MFKKLSAIAFVGAFLFAGTNSALAYDVQAGDTMSGIAKSHNVSLLDLAKLNPEVKDLNLIYVGQNIKTNVNNTQATDKPTETVKPSISATSTERDLMARLIRAEAESESYAGKAAVAKVILNRVESSQFPNSITAVIYQAGQFSPVSNGTINQQADAESIRAANEALTDNSYIGAGSLFFYNPKIATSRWLDSRETTVVIGNHTFKK